MSKARFILVANVGGSCISRTEPWPGMVATYHGTERWLMARTFESEAQATEWAQSNLSEPAKWHAETL